MEFSRPPVCRPTWQRLPARVGAIALAGLTGAGSLPGAMQFTDVTNAANIRHTHAAITLDVFEKPNSWYEDYTRMSGGAVAEDFDGDGWTDLYVLQGDGVANLLYMNRQDGTFEDEADLRGAALTGPYLGATAADYDRDGDIDIFISSAVAPHVLLVNDGNGVFSESEQVFALPVERASSPSWGDLNNDGLLELALGAWQSQRTQNPDDYLQIYRNVGDGLLEPYFSLPNAWDYLPRFLDLDNDRWQDLLVISDFGHVRYFRNSGTGLLLPAGVSDIEFGMGGTAGDFDSDGDLDLFITSIRAYDPIQEIWTTTGNRLLLNDGTGDFTDITETAGVRHGAWGWGADFADFDNDGDLDLFQVNGWSQDFPVGRVAEFGATPARLFENLGDRTFAEIAAESGDAGHTGQGRCVVVFDYDNDGDQDIFIGNNSTPIGSGSTIAYEPGPPVLLRNDTVNAHHFLNVHLAGLQAPHHSHGIGARVYLTSGDSEQMRELNASSGFGGHGPRRIAHFGLAAATTVERVRAVWTNGDETELRHVAANQVVTVASPRALLSARQLAPGEAVTAELPAEALPDGARATWTLGGETRSNPTSFVLDQSGTHTLRLTVSSGNDPDVLLWAEQFVVTVATPVVDTRSIAQRWNEQNLDAIRIDFPNPTTHARNLFATSAAMWDAWAAFDSQAVAFLHEEKTSAFNVDAARHEAISYAAFRVLGERYQSSVNAPTTLATLTALMQELGYDPAITTTEGSSPAALGNRIAATVLAFTSSDGWNDATSFQDGPYTPFNPPLPVAESGTTMIDPNRWQPLLFEEAFTQNEQTTDLIQSFVGSNWGGVRPFALHSFQPDQVLHDDPGPPPQLGGETDDAFKAGSVAVIQYSSLLDPDTAEWIDISPSALGNHPLGSNDGNGHPVNPETGEPYPPQLVRHGDFGRVLAEFWADGPDSETPPGHWNVLANELHENPAFARRFGGTGPELDPLEWDVKVYLALNGALHDAAIAAWGCKRVYDFVRPISSIRYMGGRGQSSDPAGPAYDPAGLPLEPGLIEVITPATTAAGERHAHLAEHVGEIAIRAWSAGEEGALGRVDWIRAVDWLPYQRTTFVTPAFPGYVSGHSTFSRAAAEVLTRITGSPYFPGGLGHFVARQNDYLQFETGPSTDIVLQWATYYDAADQAGLSRLYGGIHVPADDGPGRIIGSRCGIAAWNLALRYFDGSIAQAPVDTRLAAIDPASLTLEWDTVRGAYYQLQQADDLEAEAYTRASDWIWAGETTESVVLPLPAEAPARFYRVLRSHAAPPENALRGPDESASSSR